MRAFVARLGAGGGLGCGRTFMEMGGGRTACGWAAACVGAETRSREPAERDLCERYRKRRPAHAESRPSPPPPSARRTKGSKLLEVRIAHAHTRRAAAIARAGGCPGRRRASFFPCHARLASARRGVTSTRDDDALLA